MNTRELYEQARDAISLHDYDAARLAVEKLEELLPGHRGVRILSGTVAMKRGRFADAAEKFEKVLEKRSDDLEALNNLGVALKSTGDIEGALACLEKAYELAPDRPDVCYNIANCHKQNGELDQAIRFYHRAIDLDPRFSFAYNNLGTIYQAQGHIERAIDTYREGLTHDENHPTLRYNLGIALETSGDVEAAAAEYRRSLKSRPGWQAGMNNLGVCLHKAGRHEEAERVLRDLLKTAQSDPKAHNNLGTVLAALGNTEEAELHYTRALEADRSYTKAAVNLSDLKSDTQSGEDAVRSIARIAAEFPDEPALQFKLIGALIDAGNEHRAGVLLAPLLKKNPESGEAHCLMGRIRKGQGKNELAEQHFHLALEKNPGSAEPWLHLAFLARDAGEIEKAMGAVGKYIEARGDSREGSLLLADLLVRRNLYAEALDLYRELQEQLPGDERVLNGLVEVNRLMGNQAEAVRYARELVRTPGEVEEISNLDDFEKTLDLYDRMTGEYAEEREQEWNRNLLALAGEEQHTPVTEEAGEIEEGSLIDETIPDFGEDEVPVIDVGGIEPVIAVDEEEDELDLRELEEDLFLPDERDVREKKREEPAAVMDLPVPAAAGLPAAAGPPASAEPPATAPHPPPPPAAPEPPPSSPSATAGPSSGGQPAAPSSIITQTNAPNLQAAPPVILNPRRPGRTAISIKAARPQESGPDPETEAEPVEELVVDLQHAVPEEKTPPKEPLEKPANLIAYLESLTRFLPEKERESFESSDMPLRMEALRAKLEGKTGLIRRFAAPEPEPAAHPSGEALRKKSVKESFSFFDQLASFLPDSEVKISLKQRISRILNHIDGGTE